MPRAYDPDEDDEADIDSLFGVVAAPVEGPEDPFAGLTPCNACNGSGQRPLGDRNRSNLGPCEACGGAGYPDMPTEATDARPGSHEKICVLSNRYQRGEPLFHPLDNRDHS